MAVPYKLSYLEIETGLSPASTFKHTGDFLANRIIKYLGTSDDILLGDGTTTSLAGKQNTITLTTTGTSGAATLIGATLNIPQYTDAYVGTVTSVGLTSATSGVTIGNSPITSSGNITLAIASASGTQNGLLSSTDWTTFNNKQGAITLTTTGSSGASTLIGNTLNIPNYADQFVGTVTSVAALTLGTIGTDLSSTVANSTTTPVITLNVPTASATNRGALSSANWTTFNNKQDAGNYITSLTGEATATGPGAASVTLSNTAVIGKVLTGLNVTGGTVASTDSILQAFGKVQNQINGLIGGSIFQGVWNASTNNPALASGVGTNGHYYIVSVDGSTNLDGITDWKIGDWAIFAGTTWEKVDNTDAVSSVNGYTGTVSLVTGDVLEGAGTLPSRPSQLYFTNARARTAISLTTSGSSGASTYDSGTGILNVPTYTLSGLGGVPTSRQLTINGTAYDLSADRSWSVGTVTSVGLTMPVAFSVANSPITSSGSLDVTAVGTASQYIRGDGQLATLPTGGGGGSSVFYYLNGSVAASVATYKQMANTAIIGAGTDFNLTGNGLIAQFLTDAGNPNRLEIPGGAWNFEMFFNMSSSGGAPKFYVELLKYNGTTFTSIASSSVNPETISGGTPTDLYLTSLAVPDTTLLLTDRLAIRVYIVDNSGGRTATLHTENGNLCQIITTFAAGISAINGLTSNNQYLAVGTSGTDFNISSLSETHTFNLPSASATARGLITTGDQVIAGQKTFNNGIVASKNTGSTIQSTNSGAGALAIYALSTGGSGAQIESSSSGSAAFVAKHTSTGRIQNWMNSSGIVAYMSNIGELNISGQLQLGSTISNGTYTYTLPSATGTLALTSQLHDAVTLSAIGSTPNANGATLTGQVLNLQPANASFGGVVTTGTQTFAGAKTFNSDISVNNLTVGRGGGAIFSNTAFGGNALFSNITGQLNTSIGYNSGTLTNADAANQTSQTSVYIGADTRASANGNSNEIVIGCNGRGGGSNSATLGNTSIATTILHGNTSIGYTTNPSLYKLDVNGTARIVGALNGTSATFTNPANNFTLKLLNSGAYPAIIDLSTTTATSTARNWAIYTNGTNWGDLEFKPSASNGSDPYTTGTVALRLASTGAATFSSSVTAQKLISASSAFAGTLDFGTGANKGIMDYTAGSGLWYLNNQTAAASTTTPYFQFQADSSPILTMLKNGNVGIGTNTPGAKLTIEGISASYGNVRILNTSTDGEASIHFGRTNQTLEQRWTVGPGVASIGDSFGFYTGGTVKLTLTSGGNVLIGTTTDAGYKLDVNGTGRFAGNVTLSSALVSNAVAIFQFRNSNSLRWELDRETTESGSNAGSNLTLYRYDDSGNYLGTAFTLTRSTGAATFSSSVTASGSHGAGSFNAFIIKNTLNSAGSGKISWQGNANNETWSIAQNQTVGAGNLEFNYLGSNKVVLDPNGNVGIGTTTPAEKLQLNGNLLFDTGAGDKRIYFRSNGAVADTNWQMGTYNSPTGATVVTAVATTIDVYAYGGNAYGFMVRNTANQPLLQIGGGSGAATFSSSVTATAFFESSSIAGKNIIKTNPLTSLNLDVIQYTRKTDESKDVRYGYSAEQIHSLMPELTDKDVTSVKYLDVHTLLIAQLQQEIKELKAKLN